MKSLVLNGRSPIEDELSVLLNQIRGITLKQAKEDPSHALHVISNLNWVRYEVQVQLLANLIPRGSKVLELGCGWGHTTAMLATTRQDIKIIGTDVTKAPTWSNLIKFGCEFEQCYATNIPFDSGEFDVILSFGVMEHVDDDQIFLEEIYRCLKSGGYNVLFNLPNEYSFSEFVANIIHIWHHDKKYTKREIMRLFKYTGFEVINIGREHLIPAQVDRVSAKLGKIFNEWYGLLFKIDYLLSFTPLSFFCQDFKIISKKR